MSADLFLFPTIRRTGLIRRNASFLATLSPKGREKPLALLIRKQRDSLARAQVSPEVIEREVGILEFAIRQQIDRLVSTGERQA